MGINAIVSLERGIENTSVSALALTLKGVDTPNEDNLTDNENMKNNHLVSYLLFLS